MGNRWLRLVLVSMIVPLVGLAVWAAYALNQAKWELTLTVEEGRLAAVGNTSLALAVRQGETGSFDTTLRNTTSEPVSFRFYGESVQGVSVFLPGGIYDYTLAPLEQQTYHWTLGVASSVPPGTYAIVVTAGPP